MMVCTGTHCERKLKCQRYHGFNDGEIHTAESLYYYGSGSISSEGCTETSWCGPHGNWGMFIPCSNYEVTKYMEKVYEVEFMQYTNCMKDTVSDNNGFNSKYINVGKEPFLIRESDFDKYMKFGGGFRILRFVGNIET